MVQGLTEFLPISSSGHLVFFQSLFGIVEPPVFFDVMLHLGTLLAVVIYFWTDIWKMGQGIGATVKREEGGQPYLTFLFWIILATLPTALIGLTFRDWFESLFLKPKVVGGMFFATGLLLWLTRWAKKEGRSLEQMRWVDSILIGMAQGLAIIPGISRSGATLSTGLFLGLDRELAAKFSFLLSIPSIFGAALLEFRKVDAAFGFWTVISGTSAAFGIGVLSLTFLMKMIKMGKLSGFSYYCWVLGTIMIIFNL